MAHYAFLDENNYVIDVISGIDENELIEGLDPETWYGNFRKQKCLRTSYNHKIRKNYAGIGYFYDESKDAFIPPKPPFESWILDLDTCRWKAPVEIPGNGNYYWDEVNLKWIEIII